LVGGGGCGGGGLGGVGVGGVGGGWGGCGVGWVVGGWGGGLGGGVALGVGCGVGGVVCGMLVPFCSLRTRRGKGVSRRTLIAVGAGCVLGCAASVVWSLRFWAMVSCARGVGVVPWVVRVPPGRDAKRLRQLSPAESRRGSLHALSSGCGHALFRGVRTVCGPCRWVAWGLRRVVRGGGPRHLPSAAGSGGKRVRCW